ncbi:DUF4129 domain-containing protein [Paenibacillus rhizoplanae]
MPTPGSRSISPARAGSPSTPRPPPLPPLPSARRLRTRRLSPRRRTPAAPLRCTRTRLPPPCRRRAARIVRRSRWRRWCWLPPSAGGAAWPCCRRCAAPAGLAVSGSCAPPLWPWHGLAARYGPPLPGVTAREYADSLAIEDGRLRAAVRGFVRQWETLAYGGTGGGVPLAAARSAGDAVPLPASGSAGGVVSLAASDLARGAVSLTASCPTGDATPMSPSSPP